MNDANTTKKTGKHDWSGFDALTDEEVHARALADPDAQPLTEERLARMKRVPRARILRRALGLTQEEFSARYHIPIGTLRDWEQGRSEPDQTARAYLTVIGREPDRVQHALGRPNSTRDNNIRERSPMDEEQLFREVDLVVDRMPLPLQELDIAHELHEAAQAHGMAVEFMPLYSRYVRHYIAHAERGARPRRERVAALLAAIEDLRAKVAAMPPGSQRDAAQSRLWALGGELGRQMSDPDRPEVSPNAAEWVTKPDEPGEPNEEK